MPLIKVLEPVPPTYAAGPKKPLVCPEDHKYTGRRRRGRVVEGTPLLRVQARKGLEGSNPFVSATHLKIYSMFNNLVFSVMPVCEPTCEPGNRSI